MCLKFDKKSQQIRQAYLLTAADEVQRLLLDQSPSAGVGHIRGGSQALCSFVLDLVKNPHSL